MKSIFKIIIVFLLTALTFESCQDIDDAAVPINLEVNNFIWKGLNLYYLWQNDVPNLSDNRFADQTEYNTFLKEYPEPEKLFDALRVDANIDRFSWIVDNYLELEGQLQGTTNNNGVDFGLFLKPGSTTEVFGWVRYIIPNSDAATKNIKRGDLFYAVNGTTLTKSNYQSLLLGSNTNYTLNFADLIAGSIVPNSKTVDLTKTVLTENPILLNSVIQLGSHKIGYLMYNGFYSDFDTELNNAFASLKSQAVTDLVLDLRYNGGGSVQTAARLASMITGQFTGQVFAKQQWNSKIQSYFDVNNPDALKNIFTDKIGTTPINSLNMTKIYILTSKSTASASELVINGLKPHIEVVQIGDITTGKNVGSVTLYDSPNFDKTNRNPNHLYAMQPIVLKIVNSVGFGDYFTGLVPTVELKENISNLGVLGSASEPLLSAAISKITGITRLKKQTIGFEFDYINDSKSLNGIQNQMYLEKIPDGLRKAMD
jgi:carboxyl-terminal processing protease